MKVTLNKGFKFRLYPTEEQAILINKTFGCSRFIWNKMLVDKQEYYQETGSSLKVNPADYKDEFEFLREVDSLALTSVWMELNSAYESFFKKRNKFPKFKSKKRSKKSYTTNNQPKSMVIKLNKDETKVFLPKLKWVELRVHRKLPENGVIKRATISQTPTGKYYVSLNIEYEKEIPNKYLNPQNSLGLDYSSPKFYIDNQGKEPGVPKPFRKLEDKLAKEQRKLSKMMSMNISHYKEIVGKDGKKHKKPVFVKDLSECKNYQKQLKKVNKIYEKMHNTRLDFVHKLSYELAEKYDFVFVEDLNLQNISQFGHLGKATNDNGFGMFRSFLNYKMFERGKVFLKIDKWFASTQTCSTCGVILSRDEKLTLGDREWICPHCGTHHDRDINAAKNIRNEGISIIEGLGNLGVSSLILDYFGVDLEREKEVPIALA